MVHRSVPSLARIALPLAIAVLPLPASAADDERLALQGLFCSSEAKLDEALGHMNGRVGPRLAAGLASRDDVACVYADRISYVLRAPKILDEFWQPGGPVMKYAAELVGVEVGGSVRPVEPPVTMYFVRPERLDGAVSESGA